MEIKSWNWEWPVIQKPEGKAKVGKGNSNPSGYIPVKNELTGEPLNNHWDQLR